MSYSQGYVLLRADRIPSSRAESETMLVFVLMALLLPFTFVNVARLFAVCHLFKCDLSRGNAFVFIALQIEGKIASFNSR